MDLSIILSDYSYPKEQPEEGWEQTMAYIDANRDWDVANQCYKVDFKTVKDTPLSECRIYQRGVYLIVEYNGIVFYWEHNRSSTNYLDTACTMLRPDKPAKWKTLGILMSLRQCCRECIAQGWNIEDRYMIEGITRQQCLEFLSIGRKYDKQHHGQATF